ncbi:hypothetical protein AVEN_57833-1 [Araneus ventricosus]|uniref:Uncharacterized protein n=1 Tax=Araneus ventricosus TaxID=182803 RepID=A0A4Y2I8G6_ARAVE|nr:hypothetical protein AVEN_57833-1 [Araneus ventricosus]
MLPLLVSSKSTLFFGDSFRRFRFKLLHTFRIETVSAVSRFEDPSYFPNLCPSFHLPTPASVVRLPNLRLWFQLPCRRFTFEDNRVHIFEDSAVVSHFEDSAVVSF